MKILAETRPAGSQASLQHVEQDGEKGGSAENPVIAAENSKRVKGKVFLADLRWGSQMVYCQKPQLTRVDSVHSEPHLQVTNLIPLSIAFNS